MSRDLNFYYGGVDISYDNETNCDTSGCCDDYCRCGKIVNACVTEVFNDNVAIKLAAVYGPFDDDVKLYGFDRLCSRLGCDDFEVSVTGGYYGEEIEGVKLIDHGVFEHYARLDCSEDWIECTLREEYDYVLPKIQGRDWELEEEDVSNILLPNEYRKLDKKTVDKYILECKAGKILSCLVDDEHRLVDGYHRYTATLECGENTIIIVKPS